MVKLLFYNNRANNDTKTKQSGQGGSRGFAVILPDFASSEAEKLAESDSRRRRETIKHKTTGERRIKVSNRHCWDMNAYRERGIGG